MESPETEISDGKSVRCDGGGGGLGHPRVYLEMGSNGAVECPYCDKLFILKGGPSDKSAA